MLINFKPKITLNKNVVLKRLNINNKSKNYERILKCFNKQINIAKKNIDFQSVCYVKNNDNEFDIEEINQCEKIIYCFASIGKKIVDIVSHLFNTNKYLEGYMLNEIANEIVINISNQMWQKIKSIVNDQGYNLTKRYSPGENGIDLKHQSTIMNELKKHININATLTKNYMINPEKSTLFIYGMDQKIPETYIDHDCSCCSQLNCPYRHDV